MSNTQRPSTARKVTRKTKDARQEALDSGMKITIEGESYEVRMGDITPSIAREVRQEFGFGPQRFIATLASDPDVDLLAGFIWLARRIRGEYVDLDTVMGGVSYASLLGDDVEFDTTGPEELDDSPEA